MPSKAMLMTELAIEAASNGVTAQSAAVILVVCTGSFWLNPPAPAAASTV
jgi:hypothetical protein